MTETVLLELTREDGDRIRLWLDREYEVERRSITARIKTAVMQARMVDVKKDPELRAALIRKVEALQEQESQLIGGFR